MSSSCHYYDISADRRPMIFDDGLMNIIGSLLSGTARSQASFSQLLYDSSSPPVLIMDDATDYISSASQFMILSNCPVTMVILSLPGTGDHHCQSAIPGVNYQFYLC